MKKLLKTFINGALAPLNLQVVTRRAELLHLHETCIKEAFSGISAPAVIDIGAHEGQLLSEIKQLSPSAKILAIEPQPAVFPTLQNLAQSLQFQALNVA